MLNTLKDTLVQDPCDGTPVDELSRRGRHLLHRAASLERDGRAGRGAVLGAWAVILVTTCKTPYLRRSPKVQGGGCFAGIKLYVVMSEHLDY